MTQQESVVRTLHLLERGLSAAASSKTLQWLSVPAPLLQSEALLAAEPHADAWYWSSGRARFLNEAAQLVAAASAEQQPELDSAPGPFELSEPSADEWRAQIEHVKRAIATGSLQKVVLARRVLVRFARELSAARVLSRL